MGWWSKLMHFFEPASRNWWTVEGLKMISASLEVSSYAKQMFQASIEGWNSDKMWNYGGYDMLTWHSWHGLAKRWFLRSHINVSVGFQFLYPGLWFETSVPVGFMELLIYSDICQTIFGIRRSCKPTTTVQSSGSVSCFVVSPVTIEVKLPCLGSKISEIQFLNQLF